MNPPATSTLTNAEEIRRALELLIEPGEVFEIRAWGCLPRFKKGVLSGYFDDLDKATAAAVLLSQGGTLPEIGRNEKTVGAEGVYIVLNPVEPALKGRSANRLRQAEGGDTTGDQHITRRRWLLVDCDPVRVSGISSSDAEKAAAHVKAKEIARNLRESFGFPAPVLTDSGNGWHLLYRIELPADDATRIEAFLKALAARFDSEAVHVDKKVFNASRICKLYGTAARKGDSIPDRPHRESRIEFIPDPLEVVTPELLDSVIVKCLPIEEAPRADRTMRGEGATHRDAGDLGIFPMEEFIGRHGLDARPGKSYKGGTKWQIACPFDSSHTIGHAALYVTGDGAPGFNCLHDSCSGRDMQALAAHLRDTEVLARFEKKAKTAFTSNSRRPPIERESVGEREEEGGYIHSNRREYDKFDINDEWDAKPVSFSSESLPPFPSYALPPDLRAFVDSVALSIGTPASLPGVLALAAIAGASQKRVAVRVKADYWQPLTLWCVAVAPPGSRKSSAVARIRAPFAAFEARENESRAPLIEQYESEDRVRRKRVDKAEGEAARSDSEEANGKLIEARKSLRDLKPVRPLRLLIDDATPESVAVLLAENEGRLCVLDAEGATFGHMSGRYTQNPAIEVFLKSWDVEPFTSDRASVSEKTGQRRFVSVKRPALSLGVGIQPDVLSELRKNKRLGGVGALQRCLFSFSGEREGAATLRTPPVPASVEAAYKKLIADLLGLSPSGNDDDEGEPLPHPLDFTDAAFDLADELLSEFDVARQEEGDTLFGQWLAKAHGATYRIAGVLHMALHGAAGAVQKIERETLESAAIVARYFAEHTKVAMSKMVEAEGTEDARRILAWVKRNPDSTAWEARRTITLRELKRQIRVIKDDAAMLAGLEVLMANGYCREIEPKEIPEGTRGRRPGAKYQFHPSLDMEAIDL